MEEAAGRLGAGMIRVESAAPGWIPVQTERITEAVFAGKLSSGYSVTAHIAAEHEGAGSTPARRISNSNRAGMAKSRGRLKPFSSPQPATA